MPKKNKKKPKAKKKVSRKVKPKAKKKVSRKVKPKVKNGIEKELIFKTKPEWVKSALVNKKNIKKNIQTLLRIIMNFGKMKEKELLGLNHLKRLKM